MCEGLDLSNAAPRRSRFTPATSLIRLHANCDTPGGKVKTWRPLTVLGDGFETRILFRAIDNGAS